MGEEKKKSIVELTNWNQTPEEEPATPLSSVPSASDETQNAQTPVKPAPAGATVNTGANAGSHSAPVSASANVGFIGEDPGEAYRPKNWKEAVDDHFASGRGLARKNGQFGDMQDIIDYLEKQRAAIHMPTKEELEKERRRQRTEGIISGISDGVRAISNLIFTTKYAPNMYDTESSMTKKARERFDKLKKEREADADRYLNYSLMIRNLQESQNDKEYQRGREALQDQIRMSQEERALAKADRDDAMAELRMKLLEGKITQQEAAAEAEKIEADYAAAFWQSRIDKNISTTAKNNRWQPSAGRGGGSRSGGGGKPAEYPWYDSSGNKHYAHSYEAARQLSLDNGTWTEGTQQSTSQKTQQNGRRTIKTTTQTTRTGKGHSTKPKKKNRLGL